MPSEFDGQLMGSEQRAEPGLSGLERRKQVPDPASQSQIWLYIAILGMCPADFESR